MDNIQVSLVASSIRPHLWHNLSNSLQGNTINWEVIFVGDVRPNFPLPKNVIHIYASVKPAQCYQIGFNMAKGEIIHWTADEAEYNHERPNNLDLMYNFHKSFNRKDIVTGMRCIENDSLTSEGHRIGDKTTPRMMTYGFIYNNYMKELGGYDRRFVTGQGENDLVMRVYKRGGITSICNDVLVYNQHNAVHTETNTKFRQYFPLSRKFLEACWFTAPNVIAEKRLIPFEPFPDDNILVVSQEPKGCW